MSRSRREKLQTVETLPSPSAYGGLFLRKQGKSCSSRSFPNDTAVTGHKLFLIRPSDGYKDMNSNTGLHPSSGFYSLVVTINKCLLQV